MEGLKYDRADCRFPFAFAGDGLQCTAAGFGGAVEPHQHPARGERGLRAIAAHTPKYAAAGKGYYSKRQIFGVLRVSES